MKALRFAEQAIKARGIKVIGVSMDNIEDQRRFSDRYGAYFDLLCDEEGEAMRAFNVGFDRRGRPNRETFVLKDGRVIWHDPDAATKKIAEDVVQAIDGYAASQTGA